MHVTDELREAADRIHRLNEVEPQWDVYPAVLRWTEDVSELANFVAPLIVSGELEADSSRLDWLQSIMTPADTYREIYLAGLRHGRADATAFQVELQNDYGIQGETLRKAIDSARLHCEQNAAQRAADELKAIHDHSRPPQE